MASPPPSPLTTNSAASAPPDTSNKPAAPPVNILPTQLATTYSYIHPAALLSAFAARFPALVNDPVSEMAQQLPFLALAHVAYVMICLPAAGSSDSATTAAAATPTSPSTPTATAATSSASSTTTTTGSTTNGNVILRPGRVGRRRTKDSSSSSSSTASAIRGRVVASLLSLTLTTLLATPVLSILLILFGAPFTTHHAQTVLCAAHMAILSSLALVYVHGVDGNVWKEVWGAKRPGDVVWGGALGTCVGAWLGAVPVPLDWDRPWQAYPITLLTGAYVGFVLGSVLGRSVLFGNRVRFEEGEDVKKVD
ncbi:glycosylphosphatidylinositol (GPI) anchor assembly protein [Aspergillus tubingensis]|nr:glycosylphosphatidylinositol (GPI) anchor assembly protein [Aspergillus tubingensis]GLB23711.1 glycosylphosphatidylinositol (GPI) anchor assembly protein [Aspergillus tubingensis]